MRLGSTVRVVYLTPCARKHGVEFGSQGTVVGFGKMFSFPIIRFDSKGKVNSFHGEDKFAIADKHLIELR